VTTQRQRLLAEVQLVEEIPPGWNVNYGPVEGFIQAALELVGDVHVATGSLAGSRQPTRRWRRKGAGDLR
jgi:hypothetical protein